MAYLENCLPVQKYESEEFPGDGFFETNSLMETQNISSEIQSDIQDIFPVDANFGTYLLVIEAMPGFNIQASMINIGGIYGDAGSGASIVPTWEWGPNTLQPTTSALPTIMQGFAECNIKMINSNTDNPSSCDNKVYVRVAMPFSFQMPAYDVTVNIDFGGTATECSPYVTPEISDSIGMAFLDYTLIIGNGVNANTDCNLFIAKYYESLNYAASAFDVYNQQASNGGAYPPTVNAAAPNWSVQNPEFFTGNPSALEEFQPTYYTRTKNLPLQASLWNLNNTNNITTECGQLIYRRAFDSSFFQSQLAIEHPNYSENPKYINHRMDYKYIFFPSSLVLGETGSFSSQPLIESHPFLVPGDGVLPSSLCWYISVGNNANYELMPENVDVYKIISAKGYQAGGMSNPVDDMSCPVEGVDYEQILISEKANGVTIQNNSNLNINDIQCITVEGSNNKTVKLTVNFQSNYQENIWTPTSNTFPNGSIMPYMTSNAHRIFLNVYPNEI